MPCSVFRRRMGLQEIDPGTSRRYRQTDFSPEEGRPFQLLLPKDEIGYFLTVEFHVKEMQARHIPRQRMQELLHARVGGLWSLSLVEALVYLDFALAEWKYRSQNPPRQIIATLYCLVTEALTSQQLKYHRLRPSVVWFYAKLLIACDSMH